MSGLLFLFQLGSVFAALLVSRAILAAITSRLSRGRGQKLKFVATPMGSALLFAVTFVVVWCAISFLVLLGWLALSEPSNAGEF